MTQTLYLLDDDDLALLKEIIAERRNRPRNTPGRPAPEEAFDRNVPDTYVVRTPGAGIPALRQDLDTGTGTRPLGTSSAFAGNTPGVATCDVYRVLYTDTTPNLLPAGFTIKVLNLATSEVTGNDWVVAHRDKAGDWYAERGTVIEGAGPLTVRSRDTSSGGSVYTTFSDVGVIDFWLNTGIKSTLAATGRVLVEMVNAAYPNTTGVINATAQEIAGPKTFHVSAGVTPVTVWMDTTPGNAGSQDILQGKYGSGGDQAFAWELRWNSAGTVLNDLKSRLRWKTRSGTEGGLFQVVTTYTDANNWNTQWIWARAHNGSVPNMNLSTWKSAGTDEIYWLLQTSGGYIQFHLTGGVLTTDLSTSDSGTYGGTGLKANVMGLNFNAGFCTGVSTPSAPANSGSTGVKGQMTYDGSWLYICTATNTWRRVALTTF